MRKPYAFVKIKRLFDYYFPCDRILAQRIFKSTVHSTVCLIFCLIPEVRSRLGGEPAMLPLISVMVHPGRRVSGTIQGAIFCVTGLIFGLAFSLLGRFLAQRCLGASWDTLTDLDQLTENYTNYQAALAVLAVFEVIMLFYHGWMRSVSHHYFGIVFPLFLVVHFAFMSPLKLSAGTIANSYSTPFYLGIAMSIFWNLLLFPEFGSSYLGNATIEALNEIHHSINNSINFFLSVDNNFDTLYASEPVPLARLFRMKELITKKVSLCNIVMDECSYEISYSYLSPAELKNVTARFKTLSKHISAVINACQLEFVLLGHDLSGESAINFSGKKEIQHADKDKLAEVLMRVKAPIFNLHKTLSDCLYIVKITIARDFDVAFDKIRISKAFQAEDLPYFDSKNEIPKNFHFETHINSLIKALINFDLSIRNELAKLNKDLLQPNDEMFLLSSFLINLKEITNIVISLMKDVQLIHEKRLHQETKGRIRGRSIWFLPLQNRNNFKKWLYGSKKRAQKLTESESLNGGHSLQNTFQLLPLRPNNEEEKILKQKATSSINLNDIDEAEQVLPINNLDSFIETRSVRKHIFSGNFKSMLLGVMISVDRFYKQSKNHFRFGIQVSVALMLSSFPMFVPETRNWYYHIHGPWVGFVCILCLEPSIGATFWVFFLRAVGVVSGAAWGYLSYVAGSHQTNPYLEVIVTIFGAVPGFYYLLGSPYIKAAIIQIISIYIVLLAAVIPGNVSSSILLNFAKRCLAVGYGGGLALLVQMTIFPITAREQLNDEITYSIGCISQMLMVYAVGLEGEILSLSLSDERYESFIKLSEAAKSALARATAYKTMTRQEPRLKGNYAELEKVFSQVLFILKQIVDRMDNIVLLRRQYGSAIVEELNSELYPYRRHYVASLMNLLRAVQEALINKTPLPQFLPSARISHRRLINKVRKTLQERYGTEIKFLSDPSAFVSFPSSNSRDRDFQSATEESSNFDEDSEKDDALYMQPKHHMRANEKLYVLKEKFLSWNASSCATEEIIEYVEELTQLTKILVGVNEFKYGFLSRPLYEEWAAEAVTGFESFVNEAQAAYNIPRTVTCLPPRGDPLEELESDAESLVETPIALEENEPNPIHLVRMATRRSSSSNANSSKGWRKRAFSIGSKYMNNDDDANNKLGRTLTLGEPDDTCYNSDISSDEELPLALKKILSRK